MSDRAAQLRRRLDQAVARRDVVRDRAAALETESTRATRSAQDYADALPVVSGIVQSFRRSSIEKLEKPGTAALRAVFERPYGLKFEQVERRGQVEVTPMVVALDGKPVRPKSSMGGGIVDVCSVTLRPVLWAEQPNRTDPVMLLDEPAHAVNSEHGMRNLSEILRKLSMSLGLQYVIVTNRPALGAAADRIFNLTNPTGFDTQVEVVSGTSVSSHGQV